MNGTYAQGLATPPRAMAVALSVAFPHGGPDVNELGRDDAIARVRDMVLAVAPLIEADALMRAAQLTDLRRCVPVASTAG